MTASPTFGTVLASAAGSDPARPLVTFYDDATGERVELSVTTYANWVAKTAGLVHDDLGLERGDLVLLDLPTHWLGPVWLGALWTGGQVVTTDRGLAEEADLVVCGPDGLDRYATSAGGRAGDRPVVALSLRPLGAAFTEPLPTGVVDYGAVVLAQPDAFVAFDPPGPSDAAWRSGAESRSQAQLLDAAEHSPLLDPGGRLLTDCNPCSADGAQTLLVPLLRSGGTVWVARPDAARWQGHADSERATAQLRARQGGHDG
jgi:uncharacterized protein (TIGR03089 family)